MKADELFRYVAIRPPSLSQESSVYTPTENAIADTTIRKIDEKINAGIESTKARQETGYEMVKSDRYYKNNPLWKNLSLYWVDANNIVKVVSRTGNRDEFLDLTYHLFKKAFKEKDHEDNLGNIIELLQEALGDYVFLARFVKSEDFKNLKDSIWTSYFSTVLIQDDLLANREETISWIRFLYLLEIAVQEEIDFKNVAKKIKHVRPTVPINMIKSSKPIVSVLGNEFIPNQTYKTNEFPDKEVEQTEKQITINTLKTNLKALIGLKNFLYELQKLKQQQTQNKIPIKWAIDDKNTQISGSLPINDIREFSPWWIRETDFMDNKEYLNIFHQFRLDPYSKAIPDLISTVDDKIANHNAQILHLKGSYEVKRYGKTFVKIRILKKIEEGE